MATIMNDHYLFTVRRGDNITFQANNCEVMFTADMVNTTKWQMFELLEILFVAPNGKNLLVKIVEFLQGPQKGEVQVSAELHITTENSILAEIGIFSERVKDWNEGNLLPQKATDAICAFMVRSSFY